MWDKNLACNICDARFRYEYHLNIHMKSHSGEKNHVCEICNKGFALPRQLQSHMDGHNNVRRFKCDTCGKYNKFTAIVYFSYYSPSNCKDCKFELDQ